MAGKNAYSVEHIERAVLWWQQQSFISDPFRRLHGLTCGSNHGGHVLLIPTRSNDGKVVLRCPMAACQYEQDHIPNVVIKAYEKHGEVDKDGATREDRLQRIRDYSKTMMTDPDIQRELKQRERELKPRGR